MRRQIPQPPGTGTINAVRFGTETFRFLEGVQARFGDVAEVPIPGRPPLVVVTNPALAREALSRPAEFGRVPARGPAAMIAENGLVQSEGERWRRQRAIVGDGFDSERVRAYADAVGERVAGLAGEWSTSDGERRNLHRDMTGVTLRAASTVLFDADLGAERAATFHEWMQVAGRELEFGPASVAPDWLPTPVSPEFEAVTERMCELGEELIERRRRALNDGGGPPKDVLGLLVAAEADPDVDLPPNQIRDEVLTLLIAGHETTALGLTYATCLLSWHPEVRGRVREEARAVLGDERPSHGHVPDLEYTRRVFEEALRLYPPAWAVFRRATAEVRLGDYRVRDGSAVVIPQWSIHRDDRHFRDPEQFDPGRWTERSPGSVSAYFPFGSGPHACIGRQFSLSGATLTLAALARSFDVEVPEDALSDLRATPTLRPAGGIDGTVRRV